MQANDAPPVFQLENVTFGYTPDDCVLRDVSLRVDPGERIALLGANGSGKSTLLKILDGLLWPRAGVLRAFGDVLTEERLEQAEFGYRFRRRVGLVFQDPDVQLFSPTVREEVAFGPLHLGLPLAEVRERVDEAMALLDIERLADRAPHRLSGGEKKRVALAAVLAVRPDVLLLDEPTASLDPRTQSVLMEFLQKMGDGGRTIVVATHDLDLVPEIADRVYVMGEDGRVAAEGTPLRILSDTDLLQRHNLVHFHPHRHEGLEHLHPHLHHALHGHGNGGE